eukprot:gene28659-35554_t
MLFARANRVTNDRELLVHQTSRANCGFGGCVYILYERAVSSATPPLVMFYRPRFDKQNDTVYNESNNHYGVLHKHVHPKVRRSESHWKGSFDSEDLAKLKEIALDGSPVLDAALKVTDSQLSMASESVFYAGQYTSFDPIVVSHFAGSKVGTRLVGHASSYNGRRSVAHKIATPSASSDLRLVRKRKRTVRRKRTKTNSRVNRRPERVVTNAEEGDDIET